MNIGANNQNTINLGNTVPFSITDKQNLDADTQARHTHENKTILDGISAADIQSWDGKADKALTPVIVDDIDNAPYETGVFMSADKSAVVYSSSTGTYPFFDWYQLKVTANGIKYRTYPAVTSAGDHHGVWQNYENEQLQMFYGGVCGGEVKYYRTYSATGDAGIIIIHTPDVHLIGDPTTYLRIDRNGIYYKIESDSDEQSVDWTAIAYTKSETDKLIGTAANALQKTVKGTSMAVTDVSPLAHKLKYTLHGSSTQSGTPTPTSPVDITDLTNPNLTVNGTANAHSIVLRGLPVESGGNVTIGGVQYATDTLTNNGDGTGTLTHRICKTTLDFSNKNLTLLTGSWAKPDTISFLSYVLPQNGALANIGSTKQKCNIFKGGSWMWNYSIEPYNYCICGHNSRNFYCMIELSVIGCSAADTDTVKINAAKAYLTANPPTVEYVMQTPTVETVDLTAISAVSSGMTITSDGYAEITYNRDINTAITELTAAITALGGNI